MSEQEVLWLIGILLGALATLVIALARIFWNKLSEIDSGAFAAFRAMDVEREKQWMYWRNVVDRRLDEKKANIKDLDHRVMKLERNGSH